MPTFEDMDEKELAIYPLLSEVVILLKYWYAKPVAERKAYKEKK